MEKLKNRILKEGVVLDNKILKVDGFINHMIDPKLFMDMGKEFYEHFKDRQVDKVLTIEVSGIGIALTTALAFGVATVFTKKHSSKTLSADCYESSVYSYTKDMAYLIRVDKKFLKNGEKVLLIDDFLANGEALRGLIHICEQAGCEVAGIGIVIEKTFQNGGKQVREMGYDIYSLAQIKEFKDGKVVFVENAS